MKFNHPSPTLPDEIVAFYSRGLEIGRLSKGIGPLEYIRTQELIGRYFPPALAVVFDIGGGPGAYSLWLARLGYETHLVDAVPLHVEQAKEASQAQQEYPLASLEVGDARQLTWPADVADGVLLHGPLYHLLKRVDRLQALSETWRILKPGGVLLAVKISHYASTLVGLVRGWWEDADYLAWRCARGS